jgi:hypothetical protein
MILYHGSNVEIVAIDFLKSKVGKDFGVGFYLSPDLVQAQVMAEKKSLLLGGEPTVTYFEFDEEAAMADADILSLYYEHYCIEWGKFVYKNRHNKTREQLHVYDIVYGPIANDDIGMQLRRFDAELISWDQFVKELEHKGGETFQYFFGTERALKYLRKL